MMTNRPNLPQTSKDAHKSVNSGMLASHYGKILDGLNRLKTANYEKIADEVGMERHQIGRRLSELERMGFIYKPGLKSSTKSGRQAFNYSLTGVKMDAMDTVDTIIENATKLPVQKNLFE